jgi:putative transposase
MVDFRRKKIRLPASRYIGRHWYFITLCTASRTAWFNDGEWVRAVRAFLQQQAEASGFILVAYCFMPDHLHVLASGSHPDSDLIGFVKGFKQQSAFWHKRKTGQALWQRFFYDHVLCTDERWEAVANYIWLNPVRKALCSRPEEWPYSGSLTMDWRRLVALGCDPWVPPWKRKT